MEIPEQYKKNLYLALLVFLIILSVFFAVKTFHQVKLVDSSPEGFQSTISVSGHGEVNATPDIATINFTLNGEAKTVVEAQAKVAEIEQKALEVLRANDIEDKDIKTTNASFSPRYEYTYNTVTCLELNCPPRTGKRVLVGYEAYETINVKVRAIDTVGKIMEELGKSGVSNLNGPNFTIDDEDELKAEARKEAIEEAKAKAEILAKDLEVRLVGVISFYESGNEPYPMYSYDSMMMSKAESSASRAELPAGENTISSDVTITYEIK